tara:strand:- start:484 stop:795 length:312 start_codon:yes stop_codon:yes gene_type:complete
MDGIHDLGGMHGFGPIEPEISGPVFHAEWERRMFGLMMAAFATKIFNVDEFRHAIERMAPSEYLTTSYYEHWLHCLEQVMLEKGEIKRAELEAAWGKATGEAA